IDRAPASVLRDAEGTNLGLLEESDLTRLYEAGWQMPETFTVKAADGVTELFGNMWKPFDFNPKRKYPVIAEVYPGPQTEGVSHTFSSINSRQQLAQVGFIVIQVGHRGGTPTRSKAYHSYGYFNLRDYGLEDKKVAIEQLAERYSFVDVDRVGLYGHSGGGFMTAAAMMVPPYNEFFKVGVSSAGNHDNNIYNNYWSERYHGLKEVAVEKEGQNRSRGGERNLVVNLGPQDEEKKDGEKETRFDIHIPTTQELAANLKGNLLLVHGEIDNNVHPANTMRLVDALIKANKRFDLLIIPGARHGFGAANGYFNQLRWEFFAEHLLGDHQLGADIQVKD
ncbi:MAG: prolyl oligopeptidase family serine peptidase, partial [Planctomycetota bacterium]|nr:prolyl oligopeptidase family serine peptidase [Planctomycetota bacterium]